MQETEFLEALGSLTALARTQKRTLRQDQLDEFAAGAGLSPQQREMVKTYLQQQGIRLEGEEEPAREEDGTLKGHSLEQYLEELSALPGTDAASLKALFDGSAQGDAAAQNRLIEAFLPVVCDLAGEYEDPAILPEDLVQEANICLVREVRDLEKMSSLAAYQAELMNRVSTHLEQFLQNEKHCREEGSSLTGKADRLHEAARSLQEELGREVSVEELSAFLERPANEIDDLVRLIGGEDPF